MGIFLLVQLFLTLLPHNNHIILPANFLMNY